MDIQTLLKIAARGGLEREVEISSSQLAADLEISQQTAARKLKSLEDEGLITREVLPKGQTIRISSKGREVLGGIFQNLSSVFGKGPTAFTICGEITSGMGEGEYYMNLEEYKEQFIEKLGFTPFPGTMNLKLSGSEDLISRNGLSEIPGIIIDGFKKDGRTFGSVKCFKAEIEGIDGAVVMPKRTHHAPNTLEVISKEKIRSQLDLKDGNKVCVRIRIG
jgi:riboflavin kinase